MWPTIKVQKKLRACGVDHLAPFMCDTPLNLSIVIFIAGILNGLLLILIF